METIITIFVFYEVGKGMIVGWDLSYSNVDFAMFFDQGSSQEKDMAWVRFKRKQGPTQKRSTTVPSATVSNTEGMEEVKKALRDIQNVLNEPIASWACDPRAGEQEKRL